MTVHWSYLTSSSQCESYNFLKILVLSLLVNLETKITGIWDEENEVSFKNHQYVTSIKL